MEPSNTWYHPTRFTGEYPSAWAGYKFLDFDSNFKTFHPGEDYNFGGGDNDLGQEVSATASGIVLHASKSDTGYGNLLVLKHQLGYNLKRFIKETYAIETDELYSLYAHLQNIMVKVGDKINAGNIIATVGKTGTKWAHLHFEIYAPIGDLKNTDWRFYPSLSTSWTKEKTVQYYLPAYKFIEATKQMDSFESFLGKSKEYWLTVEKDRESLLKQVGEKDAEWAKKLEETEKQIGTCRGESAKKDETITNLTGTLQKEREDFQKKITVLENEKVELQNRITEILKEQAENYQFVEAIKLVVFTLKKWFNDKLGR